MGWAVALAFELMAWGCEQLFSFTAPWASWREEWAGVLNCMVTWLNISLRRLGF